MVTGKKTTTAVPQGPQAPFALATPGIRIAPSLLAADFSRLAQQVKLVEDGGADLLHLDVMDGHFVPNISFGPAVIKSLRGRSRLFFDAHLMIAEPRRYVEAFAGAGCDSITFHAEVSDRPQDVIAEIRMHSKSVGVSINPGTDVAVIEDILPLVDIVLVMSVWPGFGGQAFIDDVLPKVERLRELLGDHQRIEIDGGLDEETVERAVSAGADTIVAGSSIFHRPDPVEAMRRLRALADAAEEQRR